MNESVTSSNSPFVQLASRWQDLLATESKIMTTAQRNAWRDALAELRYVINSVFTATSDGDRINELESQLAAVRAEAVAKERQRIAALIWTERSATDGDLIGKTWNSAIGAAATLAAGSVPVATLTEPDPRCPADLEGARCSLFQGHRDNHAASTGASVVGRRYDGAWFEWSDNVPVATPHTYCANGLHSILEGSDCPSCAPVATSADPPTRCGEKRPQSSAGTYWLNAEQYDSVALCCDEPVGHPDDHRCNEGKPGHDTWLNHEARTTAQPSVGTGTPAGQYAPPCSCPATYIVGPGCPVHASPDSGGGGHAERQQPVTCSHGKTASHWFWHRCGDLLCPGPLGDE